MTPGDVYVVYKAKNPDVQQATVTVIYHDDTDDKNLPGGWTSGEQDEGTPVKYTQDDINKAIEGWKKKHYHYVRIDGTLPTTIPAQDTTVTVHLAHNIIPVNPNTPDKHGINPDQLTETFTSTLHYQTKEGKQLAPDAVQSSNWIRQVTVDEVTNKVVPDGEYTTKWQLIGNDDRYNNFNVPVEIGYVAGKTTKDGAPVTNIVPGQIKVQRNLEDTVIYDKLAGIIPVDP
ncbi:mucin-binding protein [Lactobacillus helveticus]|uniref:mucin-binding protein n=1 Tax=Lactobacillus helveticus TaxID=1587 RepID=UPI003B502737